MSTPASETLLQQCKQAGGPAIIEAPSLTMEEANQLSSALAADNIQARVIDMSRVSDKAGLLRALAAAFSFPGHFGHNWDALIDSWSDLSWLPARGYVALMVGDSAFRTAHPKIHAAFLEVCGDVAERWRGHDPNLVFKVVRGG